MHFSKKTFLLFFLFAFSKMGYAQPVTLRFIFTPDKVSTVMTGFSDTQLFTEMKAFELDKILSVSFTETLPDSVTITKLSSLGITVYLKGKRQKVKDNVREFSSLVSVGVGLGLDYGGVGMKLSLLPAKRIGVFVGFGENDLGLGYNAGLDWKFPHHKRTSGFVALMYGYNATVNVEIYGIQTKKTSYGLSGQIGARLRIGRQRMYLSPSIIIPITRDSDLKNFVKDNSNKVEELLPVLLSIGFHIGL